MRSRTGSNMSATTWMGLAVGVAAGLTAGLLAAPMRGSDMRANLRDRAVDGSARLQSLTSSGRGWAFDAIERALLLIEQGRRAFQTRTPRVAMTEPVTLTASLGEIAQLHGLPAELEERS